MTLAFFTIGHSNRRIEEFVALLRASRVRLLVDVRTVPHSRANPQFNADELAGSVSDRQLRYHRIAALGGLRGRKRDVPEDVNAWWQNQSFHNYADYAMSAEFRTGLRELRELGHAMPCAVMCAEAVWWRCHRRIISDYLLAAGEAVFHILGANHVEPAEISTAAKPGPDGSLTYPAVLEELRD